MDTIGTQHFVERFNSSFGGHFVQGVYAKVHLILCVLMGTRLRVCMLKYINSVCPHDHLECPLSAECALASYMLNKANCSLQHQHKYM